MLQLSLGGTKIFRTISDSSSKPTTVSIELSDNATTVSLLFKKNLDNYTKGKKINKITKERIFGSGIMIQRLLSIDIIMLFQSKKYGHGKLLLPGTLWVQVRYGFRSSHALWARTQFE